MKKKLLTFFAALVLFISTKYMNVYADSCSLENYEQTQISGDENAKPLCVLLDATDD